ncbi:hypothetical protein EG830_03660, partial [bacterium]|nr:hypothetical protein [bacterium]
MSRRSSISIAALCIAIMHLLPSFLSQAQTYSYRTYDLNSGLPGSYLSVIEQDRSGLLWVGVDTGLYRYDGFEFHKMPFADSAAHSSPNALFCDSEGTMWVGLADGSLYSWKQGGKMERRILEGTDKINRITEGPDKRIWIITQAEGVFLASAGGGEKITRLSMPEGLVVFDISFAGSDTLLVATQDNLQVCTMTGDKVVTALSFPELEYTWIHTVIRFDENIWFAGTDYAGLFMIRRINGMLKASAVGDTTFMNMRIPALAKGPGRSLLVATREAGVLKVEFSSDFSEMKRDETYDIISGLPDNDVRTIFMDREENLWIGLFNRGLSAITPNSFSFHVPEINREITFIGTSGGKVVMGTRSGLYDYDPGTGSFTNYRNLTSKTGGSGIVSWASDDLGNTWIGTMGDGLWLMNAAGAVKSLYRAENPAQNRINSIALDTGNIW